MSEIAVVIPSWSAERAAILVWELARRERRQRAHYYIVGVACPPPTDPHRRFDEISDWIVPEHPLSPVEAMAIGAQRALADSSNSVLVFLHDDVVIDEPNRGWDTTLLSHFAAHPRCGLAGFGGALAFAHPDIYRTSYDYRQLARFDFVSNMRDAHLHGWRVTEATQVAALDGFALVMTREFYEGGYGRHSEGAWAHCLRDGIPFHMYDAWLSCRARELGYETWMVPLAVHHEGGATSVGMNVQYEQVCERLGYRDSQALYDEAHKRIYERYARVIPFDVRVRGELPS